ncbi:MAG: protein translocase subunit SecD, partial [Pirellulales bacterium]
MNETVLTAIQLAAAVAVPVALAWMLVAALRLREYRWKIALVLFSAEIGLVSMFPFPESLKLGVDLSGGTILVYQVEQPPPEEFTMDKMIAAVTRRINPAGTVDVTVRPMGGDRVEIIIPEATDEEVRRYKRVLTELGSLEFRILANRRDHAQLIREAEQTFPNPVLSGDHVRARWVPLAEKEREAFSEHGQVVVRDDPERGRMALVVHDRYNVTGEYLRRAMRDMDQAGRPAVGFIFNATGAQRFRRLTRENRPARDGFQRRLAIVLNEEIYSAPELRGEIGDRGIIEGSFTLQEVDDLVNVLNAGSLPAALDTTPVSELTIGPTLGRDTIEKGTRAIVGSMIAVLLFMVVYYRFAGIVADVALLLNLVLVLGIMSLIQATFTLPGLAGLVLTVGMSVDANVLIFERIREERERQSLLRMAIR